MAITNVKLRFVINNKSGADGLFLVMLYIFKSGTKTPSYIGTGIYVKKQSFNPDGTRDAQNWIRRTELAPRYNVALSAIYDHALDVVKFLRDSDRIDTLTNAQIKEYIEKGDPADLMAYLKETQPKQKSFSRQNQYSALITHLKDFYGDGKPLPVGALTHSFLKEFERFLFEKKGLTGSSIKNYFSILKAVYNSYHKDNEIIPKQTPFFFFKHTVDTSTKEKNSLYPWHIQKLIETTKEEVQLAEYHARNVYLLLYFFQGIRVGDMLKMKRENIITTFDLKTGEKIYRVEYSMGKNNKFRPLPIPVVANPIIEYYLEECILDSEQHTPQGYFLPFIYDIPDENAVTKSREPRSEKAVNTRLAYVDNYLNVNFRKLCEKLGFGVGLTMHTSRHSLATHLYEKTKDLRAVQQAMAHASVVTTQKYIHDHVETDQAKSVYEDYKQKKAT